MEYSPFISVNEPKDVPFTRMLTPGKPVVSVEDVTFPVTVCATAKPAGRIKTNMLHSKSLITQKKVLLKLNYLRGVKRKIP